MGLLELLVIAGLLVLLFGSRSLPGLGSRLGDNLRKPFRQAKWMWSSLAESEPDSVRAEEDYGRECAREFAAQFPGEVAAAKQKSVSEIGLRLAGTVKGRRNFSFRTVAAPAVNAYALPGGFVFVTESLLDLCEGDKDEIAFILGHEMGHILRGHAKDRFMADTILKAVTARLTGAGQILKKVLGEGYARDQELEADREAVRVAKAANFNPAGGLRALRRLGQISPGNSGLAEYFSSHPPAAERVRQLERYLGKFPVARLS